MDELVVVAFAFLGVGGAVVLQVMSKTIAPVIVSYLLATGLAALTYRFLGGIEGTTTFTVGALKLTGALAALVGIAFLVNQQLVSEVKPPSQFQLWEVSGLLVDEHGKPVEPIDINSFSMDPPSFHHPGNGKFKLTIYTSAGLAGMEFPTLKINPRGFDGREIDLNPNASNDADITVTRSGDMITIPRIVLHPPAQPYQPAQQQAPQPVPFNAEPAQVNTEAHQ
ncbi:MAG TPA: hypothetical protein VFA85_03035 [Terriglobales bacterium]|nr:hypothetical protein [Terriglobales bacterium]